MNRKKKHWQFLCVLCVIIIMFTKKKKNPNHYYRTIQQLLIESFFLCGKPLNYDYVFALSWRP